MEQMLADQLRATRSQGKPVRISWIYAVNNPTRLSQNALLDPSSSQKTARHCWHKSFSAALGQYDIVLPMDLTPTCVLDARQRMGSLVLREINKRVLEMSRLAIHHTMPLTWTRKSYTYL